MSISRHVEAPRMEVVFIPVDEVKDTAGGGKGPWRI